MEELFSLLYRGVGGGQIDVAAGPVVTLHVTEDGSGRVSGRFVPLLEEIYHHRTELGPGQDAVGVEAVAPRAADHPHQPQDVGVDGSGRIGDIHKGGLCRRGGQRRQREGQRGGKDRCGESFESHDFTLLLLICPQRFHRLEAGSLDGGVHTKDNAQNH